jgi:hypothetical protein
MAVNGTPPKPAIVIALDEGVLPLRQGTQARRPLGPGAANRPQGLPQPRGIAGGMYLNDVAYVAASAAQRVAAA